MLRPPWPDASPNDSTPTHPHTKPQELILFSRADLERSIPSVVDGLKPGQRKILYCCFKRNLKKDIKVGLRQGGGVEATAPASCEVQPSRWLRS
jgi:hypothetical protein